MRLKTVSAFLIRRIHFTKEGVRVCVLYTADSWLQCWQHQPGIMCYDDVELLSTEREEVENRAFPLTVKKSSFLAI